MAVFILRLNLGKHFVVRLVMRPKYKPRHKTGSGDIFLVDTPVYHGVSKHCKETRFGNPCAVTRID